MRSFASEIRTVSIVVCLLFLANGAFSQTSFERVKTIFNNNCTIGCHSGSNPSGQLNLSGTVAEVYAELAGVVPVNPAAVSAGLKLVDPGYPERSFLFAKIAADIDPVSHLVQAMGTQMPQNSPHLAYEDIEMVRQWILFGADTVSDYVDPQLLSDYYNGTMGMSRMEPLPIPDPSEGIQIHYGPFFLAPLEEREFFYKYSTDLTDPTEVNRVNIEINDFGHHTALYRYYPNQDTNFAPGLRPVNSILDAAGVYYTADIIGQWPNSQDVVLPEGAAFFWNANVVLDLNYHLPNYSSDSILAGEFYMNVYTQPSGTAQEEMKSSPVYYGGNDPSALVIPPGTTDSVYRITQYETDTTYTWYIWSIMAHTHKTGQDFQVWMRNPDGTKGDNIYNGHYDDTYSFDQGYYDWQHPPFRTFDDELLEVNFTNGLIHEATFTNPGQNTIYFGLTTEDEMYVTYIQYVEEPLTAGIEEQNGLAPNPLKVYPNPTNGTINLAFDVTERDQFQVVLLNEMGQEVYRSSANCSIGRQRISLDKQTLGLSEGLYFVKVSSAGQQLSSKIVLY
ncbi:MAG: T9SS type A sorting domain-containing protein [Flavobacteriales bacterium]|nr:T9SS type A sorting domain-containing protein [Flavobacteriales bacterium]